MTQQETNENYYKYINTEHYPIKPGAMPRDVKRIIAFGEHQFNMRYYFVSESEIKILKGCRFPFRLSIKKQTKKSESFQLIDDNERKCIITINDKTLKQIHDCNTGEVSISKTNTWIKCKEVTQAQTPHITTPQPQSTLTINEITNEIINDKNK